MIKIKFPTLPFAVPEINKHFFLHMCKSFKWDQGLTPSCLPTGTKNEM